jgi:hypothetical protein
MIRERMRGNFAISLPLVHVPWLAEGLALVAGIAYLAQSFIFAHTQISILDEGSYLVKGYLFATGQYRPYQDFGPWSNHMPLSFLIPGYAQLLFGPGLRTGRYLAILLGALMLLGVWIAVRRMGGRWWAAGALIAIALNPADIKIYSLAISEVLIACMLLWVLALVLGEGRPTWQIILGAVLAGLMGLSRLNLIPAVPLVCAYIFWQHGRRAGLWATLAAGLVLALGHAVYWPGILRLWATWVPQGLAPFLAPWRPPEATPVWNPRPGLDSRLLSFFMGLRFHFLAVTGVLASLLLWPHRRDWKSESHYRASVFLVALFILLLFLHAWASLGLNPQSHDAMGQNYCIFCFPLYLGFFSYVGLLLVAASAASWRRDAYGLRALVIVLLVLGIAAGIGYAAFADLAAPLQGLLDIQVPRMKALRILPGTVELRAILQAKSGLEERAFAQFSRRALPTAAGFAAGLAILLVAWAILRLLRLRREGTLLSFGWLTMSALLIAGLVLTPTIMLGAGYRNYDCNGDVIERYEQVGAWLADSVPPRSLVYWSGGNSAVPLLYLKEASIFPPQINSNYTFRLSGDPQALARYGFWNEALARKWAGQADVILVEERLFGGWPGELTESGAFDELQPTLPTAPCRGGSSIHIYVRK